MYNRLTWLGFHSRDNIKLQSDLHSLKAVSSCLLYKLGLSAAGRLRRTTNAFTSHKPLARKDEVQAEHTPWQKRSAVATQGLVITYKNYMRKKRMVIVLSTACLELNTLKCPEESSQIQRQPFCTETASSENFSLYKAKYSRWRLFRFSCFISSFTTYSFKDFTRVFVYIYRPT